MRRSTMHRAIAIAWAILAVPHSLWWRDSVFLVAVYSIYANVVSHWGAAEACDAKDAADKGAA